MEHAERAEELVGGNPLLHLSGGGGSGDGGADFGMKRAWHEDTVFKHQSRSEPPAKKRFINDTVRSDCAPPPPTPPPILLPPALQLTTVPSAQSTSASCSAT